MRKSTKRIKARSDRSECLRKNRSFGSEVELLRVIRYRNRLVRCRIHLKLNKSLPSVISEKVQACYDPANAPNVSGTLSLHSVVRWVEQVNRLRQRTRPVAAETKNGERRYNELDSNAFFLMNKSGEKNCRD